MWGGRSVPVLERDWQRSERLPYRRTYDLKPGQAWATAEVSEDQFEAYALWQGNPVPVGALIARDLMECGASWACFTELWAGRLVIVDHELKCIGRSGAEGSVLDRLISIVGRRGGLPDVVGQFPDGRIILREAKCRSTKDRVSSSQQRFLAALWEAIPDELDVAVVEWG